MYVIFVSRTDLQRNICKSVRFFFWHRFTYKNKFDRLQNYISSLKFNQNTQETGKNC